MDFYAFLEESESDSDNEIEIKSTILINNTKSCVIM